MSIRKKSSKSKKKKKCADKYEGEDMAEQNGCESDSSPDERSVVHGRAGERGIDRTLNRWIKGVVKVRTGSDCERTEEMRAHYSSVCYRRAYTV